MSKFFKSLLLLTAGLFTATGWADSLIARWDNFTGLTSEQTLAPTDSATVNGLNGGLWTFSLGGGTVTDGVLATGKANAPHILFPSEINIGYNNKPLTVLIAIKVPVTSVDGAPFVHMGKGTANNGIGFASTDANKVCGTWSDSYWNKDSNTVTIEALNSQTEKIAYLAVFPGSDGLKVAEVLTTDTTANWQTIASGLKGSGLGASKICFGNYVSKTDAATDGLDYSLKAVAVFNGEAPLAEMQAAIRHWEGVVENDVTATLSGNVAWGEATWTPSAPNNVSNVTLTVDAASTLAMSDETTILTLTANGSAPLTIDGAKLTAYATNVNTDVTVNAGAANLGVVTIESGKTLTVNDNAATSVAGQGKLVKVGTDELTLDGSIANLISTYEVSAGKLTISNGGYYNANNGGLQYSGTPFYQVGSDGHLVLDSHDLIGWNRSNIDTVAEVAGILEKTRDANETFSGRMLLKDGGELRLSAPNDKFMLHNSAIIAVDDDATAKITGNRLKMNNGTPVIEVGENATLSGETLVELGTATKKTGAGTWEQKKVISGNGALTIESGTLRIDVEKGDTASSYTDVIPAGKVITVAQGAVLDLNKGYGYFATAGEGLTKVTGDFYYGISGNLSNTIDTALEVTSNGTLRIRNWRTNYQLAPSALRLDGTIVSEGYEDQDIKDFTVAPAVLSGNGTIGSDTLPLSLTLPENATIDATNGVVTVKGAVTLPAAMTVKISNVQLGVIPLLNTTAFASDVGVVEGTVLTVKVGDTTIAGTFQLVKTSTALELKTVALTEIKTNTNTSTTIDKATVRGVQVDLDDSTTNGVALDPGYYALKSFGILQHESSGNNITGIPVGRTISVYESEYSESAKLGTSRALTDADKVDFVVHANSGGTQKMCTFVFDEPIVLDASKTYYFIANDNIRPTLLSYGNSTQTAVLPINVSNNQTSIAFNKYTPVIQMELLYTYRDAFEIQVPANGTTLLNELPKVMVGDVVAPNPTLTIDFEEPGTFTFDNDDEASFAEIIVQGAAGGTIAKAEGAAAVTTELASINTAVTVNADVAMFTAVDIAETGALTVADIATVGTVSGSGVLAYKGVLPANMTGLTEAATWKGTLALVSTPAQEDIAFNDLGNASSTVRLQDYTGSLSNKTTQSPITCYNPKLEIKGTNPISTATQYAIPHFKGAVLGDGTITFSAETNTNYLFSGDFSGFTGTMSVTESHGTNAPKILIGDASWVNWNSGWGTIAEGGQGKIVIATAVELNGTLNAVNGVKVTSAGVITGNGTIDSALTLIANATIDASETLLTVTGDITLPDTLTVKVAETPTAVTPVSILTTTATPNVANTTVTVIVGEATLEGTFELVKNGDKLQVRVAPDRITASEVAEAPKEVTEVPAAIFLDTATFSGYGQTFTVLQYTGTGTPNWDDMYVEGLPAGVTEDDIVIDDENKTWGFATKKLSDELIWLPVGDSITEGEQYMGHPESGDVSSRGGYRYQVWKQLDERNQATRTVGFRTGHSGTNEDPATTPWAWHAGLYGGDITPGSSSAQLFNVETTLEVAGYPDVISVLIGINDLSRGGGGDTDENRAKTYAAWAELVDRYAKLRPNSKVLAATLLPVNPNNATANDFGPFNELVRAAAAAGTTPFDNSNVVLVDVCKDAFNNTFEGGYFKDQVHPNETGATLVAEAFRNAIYKHVIKPMSTATPKIAHVDNATAGLIKVLFNKEIASTTATELTLAGTNLAGDDVAITCTTSTIDGRVMTFALPTGTNLVAGTYTITLNGTVTTADGVTSAEVVTASGATVEIFGTGAAANVPSSFREGFIHRNTLNVEENPFYNGVAPTMDVIDAREVSSIEKVGYYVELQRAGQAPQFVWVSMDASAFNNSEARASIPTTAVGNIKSKVTDLAVYGNRGNFAKSITNGTGVIEFSPYSITAAEQSLDGWPAEVHSNAYGWNDTFGSSSFGSMQVARIRTERDGTKSNKYDPEAEMLFAFNGFNYNAANNTDIGIGSFSVHRNNAGGQISSRYDWTNLYAETQYAKFATNAYTVRKIELWVMPAPTTTAIINVGEAAGQYTTWTTAKAGLNLADEMESLTINFTDADQTFTFDDSATLGAVTVTAEDDVTGGTIALGNGAVTLSSLSLQTNVTAPVAFYNGCTGTVTAASATTVVAMNDATAATLTTPIVGGVLKQVGEGTVAFAPTGNWTASTSPAKFEVANGSLVLNKTSTGWNNPPQLIVSGGTLDLNNTYTFADNDSGYLKNVTSEPLVIMGGTEASTVTNGAITPYTPNANTASTIIKYNGAEGANAPATFAANIAGVYSDGDHPRLINVEQGKQTGGYDLEISGTMGVEDQQFAGTTVKKTGAGVLKISGANNFNTLEVTEGTLWSANENALSATTTVKSGATLVGAGTVATAFTLEENATLDVTKGVVTANGTVFLPDALALVVETLPTEGKPVTILYTSAFADAQGDVDATLTVNGVETDEYILATTAEAVELRVAPIREVDTVTVSTATVATWSALLEQLAANRQTLADNAALIIDFGDIDGEAVPRSFEFNNTDALNFTSVTVIGSNGGTIANAGTATVTATNLAINTSVTMNKCTIGGENTLPIETTNNIAVAQNCVLTYYINGAMSTVTVAATHSGAGKIAKTAYGTLEITNTCAVNVDVNQGQFKVNVPINGEKKSIENQKTVKLTGSTLILTSGLSYATFDGDETSIIRVDGDYTFGISNSFTNDLNAGEIQIEAEKTLTIRNYKSGYVLSPSKLLRVNGTLQRDASNGQDFTVQISDTATLAGSGTITQAIELADGATMTYSATPLTVNTVTCAEGTLYVTGASALANGEKVTLFNTTAYADATGRIEGMTVRRSEALDESAEYLLYKTETAIEVRPALVDAETWTVNTATATTWADVIAQMEDDGKRPAATTALTIDFGDVDGEAVSGNFSFGEGDVTLGSLTVIGSNGGTVTKTGTGAVTVSTAATINTAVAVTGQVMLNGVTIAENGALSITDWRVIGDNTIAGAGLLTVTGATLPTDVTVRVTDAWTGTVKLTDITDDKLNLANMVTANSNLTLNNVKAYIYDCTIATLTLEGDFQMNNGTTTKSKTQCVTVNTLVGAGTFKVADGDAYCTAINAKTWTGFTGSIDIGYSDSQNTIVFLGEAPDRFTTSITPGDVGANDSDFTEADYGTIYVTEGKTLATTADTTWHLRKLVVETGASFQIKGWATIATSCSGAVSVESGATLDLRALNDLSGINATVEAGGRILVKSGARVPDSIVFETGAILGICPASVDDIGNATLTVTAEGTANSVAEKVGYKTDGVTPLGNWTPKGAQGDTLSFGYNPIFDGELCWWAYEFDADENTTTDSTDGPDNTGRDKNPLIFDGSGSTGRILVGEEYVTNDDGTKALHLAAAPHRTVSAYPEAFTATVYGKLTSQPKTILWGFGSTFNSKDTIALVTGASANEVSLVWVKGSTSTSNTLGSFPENCVTTLATTTVPNGTTENHLFGFSYELKDANDDGTKDTTEIVFYVDGDKYQPYKVNKIITLGGGFQTGSLHGGWPREGIAPTASDWLNRMGNNDADKAATIEFLRVYDEVLPETTFTAMANAYPYISKVGRATRKITGTTNDTTWHEAGEWSQVKVVDGVAQEAVAQNHPDFGTIDEPEVGTQVVLNVDGANTLYLNEFYSTTTNAETGETETIGNSKLYYERLEINGVAGGAEDSLTMWAGRLNPAIEEEDPLKNSQSAVITVQGYTKINTNVTMAHNVAYLSGPVAVAEGKTLTFDFSGFDVMKVPMMPTEYRLTGFLDEETRERVTHNFQGDNLTVNARWVDLSYKTDVNQYTFKVDRYPVTAYFRNQDDIDLGADGVNASQTAIDFNNLYYMWEGLTSGKLMDWDVDTVDADGNHVDEHILANFVSVDAETQQPKIVTVTLDTINGTPIDLTLPATALKKTVTHGNDGNGDPIWEEVNMLGEQQLIVAEKVTVNYTGENVSTLAPFVKEVSGMVKATAMGVAETPTEWRGNLTLDNGEDPVAIAGANTISGKLVLGKSLSFAADADVTAKDADLTAVKNIRIVYDANKTEYKLLTLGEGHTAKSLEGCTVTAVDGENEYTWTESGETKKLVVIRNNALYVTGRPVVKAGENEVKNNDLTLPLARRAAELSATSVSLTGVVNMAGNPVDASVADAAEVFTNVAFNMNETVVDGVVTAQLKYDFGVSKINVVTIGGTQYVVAELIVSNAAELANNSADYADGVTVDVVVKKGEETQTLTMTPVADMTGAEAAPATVEKAKRYIRFPMPSGNGTFEIKARASK